MTHAVIIDDDANNLAILQQLLTMEGVSYTAVQDANQVEAVIAGQNPPDLIFLDLEMPDIDGYQMLKLLKANQRLDGVPIIAHTVHTAEIHTARELGFDGFVSKPLKVDRFHDQLQNLLNGTPVWEVR